MSRLSQVLGILVAKRQTFGSLYVTLSIFTDQQSNLHGHLQGTVADAVENKSPQGFSTAGGGCFWLTNASDGNKLPPFKIAHFY